MIVQNIGIIIRTTYGDTYPVALTTQMVGVIQNLLTQIPMMNQNIVGPDGMKAGKVAPSIPIIPRDVGFDWETAYEPMEPLKEKEMMEAIAEKYRVLQNEAEAEAERVAKDAGVPLKTNKPALLTDPDNPFNLELEASGRSNVVTDMNGNPVPLEDTTEEPNTPEPSEQPLEPQEACKPEGDTVPEDKTMDSGEFIKQVKEVLPEIKKSNDVTVTPDTLGIGAGQENPGG